jgi:hypothetical protein
MKERRPMHDPSTYALQFVNRSTSPIMLSEIPLIVTNPADIDVARRAPVSVELMSQKKIAEIAKRVLSTSLRIVGFAK